MLQTVEAIVDTQGKVRLLEEVHVSVPTRAILTLLESSSSVPTGTPSRGTAEALLHFLRVNPLPDACRRPAEEIDKQIREERNAWD